MKLKDIFRTAEGMVILAGFSLVIVTGAKIFAYLGLGAYIVINLPNGIDKIKSIYDYVKGKITSLFSNPK